MIRLSQSLRRRSSAFAGTFNYTVYVQTGDRPKAGTDANVYIVLHGEGDQQSKETKLDVLFHDDFERGQLDKFKLKYQPFSTLEYIELWRDTSGFKHEWHIDTIMVVNKETKIKTVFPIFRWIRPNYRYKFFPLDTSLPQYDQQRDQRQRELEEKRLLYELEPKSPGLPPQVKTLPLDEQFSFDYTWDIAKKRTKLILTSKLVRLTTGNWKTLDDIENIYTKKVFVKPSDLNRWRDDEAFGLQRIAGVNNVFIQLCKNIPSKFLVTDDMLEPFLEGLTLPLALSDRRVFIVDYDILENCPSRPDTKVCAPMALFFLRNDGSLVPIAIQLNQTPAEDNPVFLPSDPPFTWILAKMWFNNADVCVHQAITHLGFTHLIMEGVAVVTHRQLSQSHPVFKLLAPHFLYLIAINSRAVDKLMCPSGWIEDTMAIGVEGFHELIRRYKAKWRIDLEGTLPADLRQRGVDDPELLKQYHFRSDALLIYEAIKKYVTDYLKIYYDTDDTVLADEEIQNWRAEMVKPEGDQGLGIQGIPGNSGKFTSKEQIVTVCTCIIYTCSVGHAAANFKQYDEYAFPLNYPTRLCGTPPTSKDALSEKDILLALPDKQTTLNTMIITKILSQKTTKSLGDFEVNYIYDPPAIQVVKEFREELKKISSTIKSLNKSRNPPFPYLDPLEVPNAISV